jgi:hypothetical protein
MKCYLYLLHRWLGVSLFMALWLVSGVMMMYVDYPKLTEIQRLTHMVSQAVPPDAIVTSITACAQRTCSYRMPQPNIAMRSTKIAGAIRVRWTCIGRCIGYR